MSSEEKEQYNNDSITGQDSSQSLRDDDISIENHDTGSDQFITEEDKKQNKAGDDSDGKKKGPFHLFFNC